MAIKDKNTSGRELIRLILMLAWPTMLEELLETAVSYIDAAMVGRIGPAATAAIGCTQTVNWLIGSAVFATGIGFLSYISHEIGAKHPENAGKAAAQVTGIILMLGSVLTILALSIHRALPVWMRVDPSIRDEASRYFFIIYVPMLARTATTLYGTCLRAAGDTRTPLKVTMLVNVINIILNFLLIYPARTVELLGMSFKVFGAGLGVTGAALASAASFLVGGIGMARAVYRHPLVSPAGHSVKPDPAILKPVMRISLPCILQRIFTSSGYVVFASMVNGLGAISTAAHSIANTAESAFYIPGYGMQTAASTLAGNCWGEGNGEKLKRVSRLMMLIEVSLMAFTGTLLFCSAGALMRLFTKDAEVIRLGCTVLRMVAVTEPIYGLAIILNGIFQGVGDTKAVFIYDTACMWGIRILGTFLFVCLMGHGLVSAWGCMIAHNIFLGILLTIRYVSGKWDPIRHGRKMH